MKKLYMVELNSQGAPNFATAVEQPERKKGKWIHHDDGNLSYKCSECGRHAYGCYSEIYSGEYHFCPFCGADMRGEI